MRLSFDNRSSSKANIERHESSSWEDVDAALAKLDQRTHTEVTVTLENVGHMAVGGDGEDCFLSVFTEDERSFVATDLSRPSGTKLIVVGGQVARIDNRRLIGLETVRKAMRHYCDTGSLLDTIAWIEE